MEIKEGEKLIVDDREPKKVAKALKKYYPDLIVRRIEIGDVIDEDKGIAIERKNILDLGASISDGRVFNQAEAMSEAFKYPFIIQVGSYETLRLNRYSKISINRFLGALSTLAISYKVPVIQCENLAQFARYTDSLMRKVGSDPTNKSSRKKRKIKNNQELSVLMGLSGFGESRCRDLLKNFSSIRGVCDASEEDLATINGIGKKQARKIKKVFY